MWNDFKAWIMGLFGKTGEYCFNCKHSRTSSTDNKYIWCGRHRFNTHPFNYCKLWQEKTK